MDGRKKGREGEEWSQIKEYFFKNMKYNFIKIQFFVLCLPLLSQTASALIGLQPRSCIWRPLKYSCIVSQMKKFRHREDVSNSNITGCIYDRDSHFMTHKREFFLLHHAIIIGNLLYSVVLLRLYCPYFQKLAHLLSTFSVPGIVNIFYLHLADIYVVQIGSKALF